MRRELILALVLLPVLSLAMVVAQDAEEPPAGKLGDKGDGSRAHPVHQIPLIAENEDGEKGAPVALDDDVVLPFRRNGRAASVTPTT